jgi:hypothetical protein
MSAEVLRQAARLMRENATTTEAMGDPWYDAEALVAETDDYIGAEEAAHIASWPPAVALAVADWLDTTADNESRFGAAIRMGHGDALAVARAYLGSDQ